MEFLNGPNPMVLYPLPEGWSIGYCVASKRYYYINNFTNKTQWNRPTGPAPRNYPVAIKCSRILIKHRDSEPDFWRVNYIPRTKREAAHVISKCYVLITTKQFTFEEVAFKYSECPSAHRGGDLQWLNLYTVSPYFLIAFNLDIGDLTLPVETPEGFEIFQRTG
ncbi:PREDICTED: peptidyl-prolyl cis-trans isomerase pin1-like [Papilio xuthus]|uniref:Peptidyl-prolyl cis-trans isomerase n=1 Tax=Papilio xuthus TaxID=66420 RepID=A0A194PT29_PAPXU|nr:PREDICTED: peptidyl-prolyl cis-trans isomerase pin1-like [Papilio xuthus]KPI96123.1 Peptidyl-prolyl cis-trans isomerase NIMA-interacting 1 [Papilio xuthus]